MLKLLFIFLAALFCGAIFYYIYSKVSNKKTIGIITAVIDENGTEHLVRVSSYRLPEVGKSFRCLIQYNPTETFYDYIPSNYKWVKLTHYAPNKYKISEID